MPAFVDTNVAVYALGRDSDKKARAKRILDDAPIASSWVVVRGSWFEKRTTNNEHVADAVMKLVAVAPVTANTVRDAMTIGLRYGLSHWDSLIVAAALATGCDTLYSEDMQDGQVFEDRLTVRNPFAAQPKVD